MRGFTLIELLVVMVIMAVMVSLVAPDLFSSLKRVEARGELRQLRETADLARLRSFYSNHRIVLRLVGSGWSLVEKDNNKEVVLRSVKSGYFEFEPTEIALHGGNWPANTELEVDPDNVLALVSFDLRSIRKD